MTIDEKQIGNAGSIAIAKALEENLPITKLNLGMMWC